MLDTVVCGGTFDHFHRGHESFLRYIIEISDKVILGLATDKYAKSKRISSSIQNYSQRKSSIEQFFKQENALDKLEIEPIDDLFIPKKWEKLSIDAIVVSPDTQKGAEIINQDRKKKSLPQLRVIVTSLVYSEDGVLISSQRIRNGEIDRLGRPYVNPLWLTKDLLLPENLRNEFKKPFGELLKEVDGLFINKDSLIITVGDVTTKTFNEKSLGQNISIIDFKVAREKKYSNVSELGFAGNEKTFKVNNPPGHITSNLFKKLVELIRSHVSQTIVLEVDGEEDLAVLPIVLLTPLGTLIYYGQPSKGVVRILVSEQNKKIAYGLVDRFEMLK